jgi:hypothetical protein
MSWTSGTRSADSIAPIDGCHRPATIMDTAHGNQVRPAGHARLTCSPQLEEMNRLIRLVIASIIENGQVDNCGVIQYLIQ